MGVVDELRRAVGTAPRKWLAVATGAVGLVSAIVVTAAAAPADRSLATIAAPVQSLMSITVPFFGIIIRSSETGFTGERWIG